MRKFIINAGVLVLSAVMFWSCEKTSDSAVNPDYTSPLLLSVVLDRTVLNLDTDTSAAHPATENLYSVRVTASVKALRQSSTGPYTAAFTVLLPRSTEPVARITGTLIPMTNDTMSAEFPIDFSLLRSDIGTVTIRCLLRPGEGLSSNELSQTLFVTRHNSRPKIESVSVPDTVTIGKIQSADSSFLITATVSDSDGITDINPFGGVQFLSLKPDSTFANLGYPIYLFDDGNENILFPPDGRSGDAVKGDGTFSFRVRLLARVKNSTPPPDSVDTQRGRYIFKFYALDNSGASSDTVDKPIIVR